MPGFVSSQRSPDGSAVIITGRDATGGCHRRFWGRRRGILEAVGEPDKLDTDSITMAALWLLPISVVVALPP
jgi:hypothetical protein